MGELINLALSNPVITAIIVVVFFVLSAILRAIRILKDWERAVVLRLGRYVGTKGGGLVFLIPFIENPIIVDTRIVTMDVPKQEVMTRDNVPVMVDAVVLFKVIDPKSAVLSIGDYHRTASLNSQTSLRNVIGQVELDALLSERDQINSKLQAIIDEQTESYGVKVTSVEVRDVSLPESMKRAMARQAEAEREKRSKIINAEGEFQAAERLTQAAQMIASQPTALQLRYLQTMNEIATERNSFIFMPLPMDLMANLSTFLNRSGGNETAKNG